MLRGRRGGVLILDITLIEKRGREMEGIRCPHNHNQRHNVWRYYNVTTMHSDNGERVSLHLKPYVKQEACTSSGGAFSDKNKPAVDRVDEALEYVRPPVVVLDS